MPVPLSGPAPELAAVVCALFAGAALSALERAVAAFGEVRLIAARDGGGRYAALAGRLLEEGPRLHTRLLSARVCAIVVAAGLTAHATRDLAPWWAQGLALGGAAVLYAALAVGGGAIARAHAATLALPMARWLGPLSWLALPVAIPLAAMVSFLAKRFPPPAPLSTDDHAVREVEHMIEQREESGSIPEDFAELLLSVLEFKDTVAREVMVPRTQMEAIEITTSLDEVLETIIQSGHSRYPVYRERVDHIEGILYAKDLFRELRKSLEDTSPDAPPPLRTIIRRPVYFVAETHKIGQLLREMQSRRFHLAVVVDEFGGTSGIVTLEDIVEEIVGEIHDEHDTDEPMVEVVSDGRWWVDAQVSVYDLADALGVDIAADGDFDSVGGMIVDLAGRVPQDGESVTAHGFEFVVRGADERHVTRVEVLRVHEPDPDDADVAAE